MFPMASLTFIFLQPKMSFQVVCFFVLFSYVWKLFG